MNVEEWYQFLKRYSIELLQAEDLWLEVPDEAISNQWLGYPPASESQIYNAEQRLGRPLPPSLRNFYLVTNGWYTTGCFIYNILPVEKIDWLQAIRPHLYEIAIETENHSPNGEVSDWLLDYRYEQGTKVKISLAISSEGDAAIWLLDPGDKDRNGEWAAGRWASWNPAMEWTATSFEKLMLQEFEFLIARESREEEL